MLIENSIYGQKIVHGLILDENGSPFLGVNITESSQGNKTVTDINGNFEISVQSDSSCIKVNFIGYMDTLVCNMPDTVTVIRLIPDIKTLNKVHLVCVDYTYVDNVMVGFYSGLLHTPYGITFSDFTSHFFKIPFMTFTQIDYRADFKNNQDFHFGLARYHGDNQNDFRFGLSYDYDKIKINDYKTNLDYFSHKFNTTWNYKRSYLFIGYGYSKIYNNFHNGFLSGLSLDFPIIHIGLLARLNYWFDYIEYSVDLYKGIPKTNFNLSAGFEQLDKYREFNIRLRYEIDY